MQVHTSHIDLPEIKHPVVTVGIFDGVHKGHQAIISILKQQALKTAGETVIVTLWPHPRQLLYPGKELKLLSSLEEKQLLLHNQGIDHLVVIPFSNDFANLTAAEFIKLYLVESLKTHTLLVGFDNHFGKNKAGGFETIKSECEKWNIATIHPAPVFEGRDRISSTDIRLMLELGEISLANKLLSHQYTLTGKVVEGRKLGRTIGFPTANLEISDLKMLPRVGVYAVLVNVQSKTYPGMLNIGFRPTVEHNLFHKTTEVHLINFEGDLYNTEITVTFVARIRDEIKFPNIRELTNQLRADKQVCLSILEK